MLTLGFKTVHPGQRKVVLEQDKPRATLYPLFNSVVNLIFLNNVLRRVRNLKSNVLPISSVIRQPHYREPATAELITDLISILVEEVPDAHGIV